MWTVFAIDGVCVYPRLEGGILSPQHQHSAWHSRHVLNSTMNPKLLADVFPSILNSVTMKAIK